MAKITPSFVRMFNAMKGLSSETISDIATNRNNAAFIKSALNKPNLKDSSAKGLGSLANQYLKAISNPSKSEARYLKRVYDIEHVDSTANKITLKHIKMYDIRQLTDYYKGITLQGRDTLENRIYINSIADMIKMNKIIAQIQPEIQALGYSACRVLIKMNGSQNKYISTGIESMNQSYNSLEQLINMLIIDNGFYNGVKEQYVINSYDEIIFMFY